MTTKVVKDEQRGKVGDEEFGIFAKRAAEVSFRVSKGVINAGYAKDVMQALVDDDEITIIKRAKTDWLAKIIDLERQYHLNFFGREFDFSGFEKTLKGYGRKQVRTWGGLGLEPHYLPEVVFNRDGQFPGWKVKPNNWFWDMLSQGKVLRDVCNKLVPVKEARLEGIAVLIDTRLKPAYRDGKQMYADDNLLAGILQDLRKENKIDSYNPNTSRFGVSADEWEKHVKKSVAEKLGLSIGQLRLETALEGNVIPQLYADTPRKDDGTTNTWERREEYFGSRGRRLGGGYSGLGGLAHVDWRDSGDYWFSTGLRFLAVL